MADQENLDQQIKEVSKLVVAMLGDIAAVDVKGSGSGAPAQQRFNCFGTFGTYTGCFGTFGCAGARADRPGDQK